MRLRPAHTHDIIQRCSMRPPRDTPRPPKIDRLSSTRARSSAIHARALLAAEEWVGCIGLMRPPPDAPTGTVNLPLYSGPS